MYHLPGLTLSGFCVKIWVVQGDTKYVPRGTTRVQGGTKYVPPAWANPKWGCILCMCFVFLYVYPSLFILFLVVCPSHHSFISYDHFTIAFEFLGIFYKKQVNVAILSTDNPAKSARLQIRYYS